jgi:uncharacterized protein
MEPLQIGFISLLVHAALGATDTFYSHEWVEQLPRRLQARRELTLHATRSVTFVALFIGVAWFDWNGAWWLLLPGLIATEYAITLCDSVEEDRSRVLRPFERINHMLLALNTGVYATALCWHAWHSWRPLPTSVTMIHRGAISWLLGLCAAAIAIWVVRDAVASYRLGRMASRST